MNKSKILFTVCCSFLLIFPQTIFTRIKHLPERNIQNQTADLLIVGGTVVTMDKDRLVIEDGAVVVRNGEIVQVGKRADLTKNVRARQTIDAQGKVIIPGLINTHTH